MNSFFFCPEKKTVSKTVPEEADKDSREMSFDQIDTGPRADVTIRLSLITHLIHVTKLLICQIELPIGSKSTKNKEDP